MTVSASSIEAVLGAIGIAAVRHDHPPVSTCEEAVRAVPETGATHTKNLFLRDKRGRRHVLLVTTCDRMVNIRAFADRIGADTLSFASPDRLMRHLGVAPGAVTILGLANDPEHRVELFVDEDVWRAERFHAHPLVNTATLVLTHDDLVAFLRHTGHVANIVRL